MIQPAALTTPPVDSINGSANVFNLPVLTHSFQLLRCPYPSLALVVQNLTASLHPVATTDHIDTWVAIQLAPEQANAIVSALSDVAEQVGEDSPSSAKHRVAIHRTLLAWLNYVQSILEADPENRNPPAPSSYPGAH